MSVGLTDEGRKYLRLKAEVACWTQFGDTHEVNLGAVKMPDGYALLYCEGNEMFNWVRWDGVESEMWGNRWNCRRDAVADSRMSE